jgi:hypothetical protein
VIYNSRLFDNAAKATARGKKDVPQRNIIDQTRKSISQYILFSLPYVPTFSLPILSLVVSVDNESLVKTPLAFIKFFSVSPKGTNNRKR